MIGDDRFGKLLQNPTFCIYIEVAAGRQNLELLKNLSSDEGVFGTLVTGQVAGGDAYLRCCEECMAVTARPVMAVLSGANVTEEQMRVSLENLRAQGVRDFLCVTGDISIEHMVLANSGGVPLKDVAYPYLESTKTIRQVVASGEGDVVGAVVNPFKYLPEDLVVQYTKMQRKLNEGARFLVAQIGWDLKKHQELIWYLRSHGLLTPVLARLSFLCERDGQRLSSGLYPGVPVPLWLSAAVSREASSSDFLRKQASRMAFFAIGCRLLGYSGVVVNGIETAEMLRLFLDAYEELLAKYENYAAWAKAAHEQFKDVALVPFDDAFVERVPFYLYQKLLDPQVRDFDPYSSRPVRPAIGKPSLSDRMEAFLSLHSTPQWIRKMVRKKFPGVMRKPEELCFGLDGSSCPKHLLDGPCGGALLDGRCECGSGDCFFHRVLEMAQYRGDLAELEGGAAAH